MHDTVRFNNEDDPGGSPDLRGWVNGTSGGASRGMPGIDALRCYPHEFSPATPFFIKRVKLAALEKVGSSYQIGWTFSNPSAVGTTLTLIAANAVAPGTIP